MAAISAKMKGFPRLLLVLLVLSMVDSTTAFWRLLCHGTLGTMRVDPIMSHGRMSSHAHIAFGARNFNYHSSFEDLMASNCTSCSVIQDRSLYWTPQLYFQFADNSSFVQVGEAGGSTAYYFNNNVEDPTQLVAFEPGFQMVAGDANKRNASICDIDKPMSAWNETDMTQECLSVKALGFNCLDYSKPAEGSMEFHYLRNKTYLDTYCKDGVRAELQFPSCGNGSIDSSDHKSHVLYPNLGKTGECPKGFEHRYPVLFYETIYTTNAFKNVAGHFLFSNGDPTGYGYHGDFISGWPQDVLTEAVHTCNNGSGRLEDCPVFQLQSDEIATSCKADVPTELMHEINAGPVANLPGNVAIAYGPGPAIMGMNEPSTLRPNVTSSSMTVSAANASFTGSTMSLSAVNATSTSPMKTLSASNPSSTSLPHATSAVSSTPAFSQTSYTNTSHNLNLTSHADTTSRAPGPVSTPTMAPTARPETMTGAFTYTTATSSFVSDGVTVDLVLVEEVQTVTVELTQYETATVAPVKHRRHRGHAQHFRGGGRL